MNLLKNRKQTEFIRQENIGGLKYISAYAPLIDEDGHTVAFLNIPYFSKQKQINEELLKEVIGHTPRQVYAGVCWGIMVGFIVLNF